MDVLTRAGLVELDEDVLRSPHRSPNLSRWATPSNLLKHYPNPLDLPLPSPSSTSLAKPIPQNLINLTLPPELLLFIFSSLTHSISDTGPNWHYSPHWLTLTHVCTHWRITALSSPLLWSRISFAHPDLASAMLSRSRDAPLDIAYGDRLARLPPLGVYTALAQLSRISKLRLNVTRALLAHLAARLPISAPSLRRLHIDLVDGVRAPGAAHALPGIADLQASQLRVLILDGVPLPPTASLLVRSTQLTELVLSGIPRPARWCVADMLRTLSRMPHLIRLLLVHAVEEDYDDEEPGPDIALHKLEQLTVHAATPAVSALVSSITSNPQTRYTLSCAARVPEDTALSSSIPPILRTGVLKQLDVAFQLTQFSVRGYTECDGPCVLEMLLEPERVLDAKHSSGRASLIELVQSTADFSSVEQLNVMNDGAISRDDMDLIYDALARRIPSPIDFGVHVRDMDYDGGALGSTFLCHARRIRVRIGSWLPDDDRFGCTGRDWAVACIRKWSFDSSEGSEGSLEELVLDKESFTGTKLLCLLGLDPPSSPEAENPPWMQKRPSSRIPVGPVP
ncbi:hypothetical protein PENSPDRAFT_658828 [Peniophora sp. CONT]|nr:hypothetical protein PENSPDRAFT_658828 [Peniophora sp. CONT]